MGGFPAEARGVETETALVFREVEIHAVKLCGFVVPHRSLEEEEGRLE